MQQLHGPKVNKTEHIQTFKLQTETDIHGIVASALFGIIQQYSTLPNYPVNTPIYFGFFQKKIYK